MKHIIKINQQALSQIILSGFEAFVIKHGEYKRSGIEFHASVFGDIRINQSKSVITHDVQFISVNTSSKLSSGQVEYLTEAMDLKDSLAEQLGYSMLGTMHSHPYMRHEMELDQVRSRGCNFSDGDLATYSELIDRHESSEGYHLEILLTIKHLEKANTQKDGRIEANLFEFSVGNCKCFLRTQVFSKDDDGNLIHDETELQCEYLESHSHLQAEFARIEPKAGKKRMLEYRG